MPRKQTQQEFIEKSIKIFGDQYYYSKVIYVNSFSNIILTCKRHGDFEITPNAHISYKRGCSVCSGVKYNTETFIDAAHKIHNYKYDYSKVEFSGIKKSIIIICKEHGEFNQIADKHLNSKQGCPKCDKSYEKDFEYIVQEARKIHGELYNYKLAQFTTTFDKIKIECPTHGVFLQTPSNHIHNKQGCPKCATERTRLTKEEFMNKAAEIHGNIYNYILVNYIDFRTKIEIICQIHGSFFQTPGAHLQGNSCPKCTGYISKMETSWLDSLGVPIECRQKSLKVNGKRFKVDAYVPSINTVYEFNGDYWHGNPEVYNLNDTHPVKKITYGELYKYTLEKEEILKYAGYNVISIWENDWK